LVDRLNAHSTCTDLGTLSCIGAANSAITPGVASATTQDGCSVGAGHHSAWRSHRASGLGPKANAAARCGRASNDVLTIFSSGVSHASTRDAVHKKSICHGSILHVARWSVHPIAKAVRCMYDGKSGSHVNKMSIRLHSSGESSLPHVLHRPSSKPSDRLPATSMSPLSISVSWLQRHDCRPGCK